MLVGQAVRAARGSGFVLLAACARWLPAVVAGLTHGEGGQAEQLGREECRPGPKEGEVVWTPFPAT
jgi:hypothetical protein